MLRTGITTHNPGTPGLLVVWRFTATDPNNPVGSSSSASSYPPRDVQY